MQSCNWSFITYMGRVCGHWWWLHYV